MLKQMIRKRLIKASSQQPLPMPLPSFESRFRRARKMSECWTSRRRVHPPTPYLPLRARRMLPKVSLSLNKAFIRRDTRNEQAICPPPTPPTAIYPPARRPMQAPACSLPTGNIPSRLHHKLRPMRTPQVRSRADVEATSMLSLLANGACSKSTPISITPPVPRTFGYANSVNTRAFLECLQWP